MGQNGELYILSWNFTYPTSKNSWKWLNQQYKVFFYTVKYKKIDLYLIDLATILVFSRELLNFHI